MIAARQMPMDPPPNSGFFNSAHNFAVMNAQFTEVTQAGFKYHLLCL